MSGVKVSNGFSEAQTAATKMFNVPLLEGVSGIFATQADLLRKLESQTPEFLRRRQVGCMAARELLESLRDAREPADIMKSQQQWLADATQRMIADAQGWWTIGLGMMVDMASSASSPALAIADAPSGQGSSIPSRGPGRDTGRAPLTEHRHPAETEHKHAAD